ncbi:MAG: hypothetical protein J6K89_02835 [Oscillospiraceae bacterium]|nr:hypothetical protein [Oscillospiraceae bacterium]
MNLIYSGLSAQTVTDMVMGFSGVISVIFLVVILFFGCYGMYGVIKLRKEQYLIPHRLMYPNYCSGDDCEDPGEYMDYIRPRLTILSVTMLLGGLLLFLGYFIPTLRSLGITLILYITIFAMYIWYSLCLRRAKKKYW